MNADELRAVESMRARVQDFADEMKREGIHVGMGNPARCVTCDEPWPCASSSDA